jgi:hypothetical protein
VIAPPAWLLALALAPLLVRSSHAYRLLPGPMEQLTAPVATGEPAPVPGRDAAPPEAAVIPGTRLVPALTNRLSGGGPAGQGYSPGSVYSPELERRHDSGTNIGNILAPGLQLLVPLK